MKPTPGPWVITGFETLKIFSNHPPKMRRICSVAHESEEDKANAKLIAAAPEMLDVLERLVIGAQMPAMNYVKILEEANALVKKAKGIK